MAPEQIAGGEVGRRTDLYAWGVVAWELLAGHHPFNMASTAQAIMAALLAQTAPELGTVRADVPTSLGNLVRRCLEKDPDLRPASAGEVLAALDDVATPKPVAAPPPATSPAAARRRVALGAAAALGVAAIVLGTVWRLGRSPPSTSAAPAKSIAVLPCESVGGDTANVYFAEGMADELTTALTAVDGLRVAATSSAFTYRGRTADPRDVGRALNVGTVLQCKVRRAGSVLRLSAQLTNATDGLLLWSRSYDREAKDVFAVQDELAREIAGALRITLAGGASVAASHGTRDVEAYDLYLRGRYFLNQRGPGVAKSIPYFRQAIARDSMYADAWAQLGTAYGLLLLYDHVAPDTTLREARTAIGRALQLDSLGAEAHAASGLVFAMANQWARAWAAYQRAIRLDPNDAATYRFALATLSTLGREADAMEAIRVLMERDPLSGLTSGVIAMTQLDFGHREEALASARRAVELDSSGALPRAILAMAELVAGQRDSARTLARTTRHTPNTTPWIGWVLGATDRQAAADLVREVEALRGRYASVDITWAFVALGAGDTTAALDALERAARGGEPIGWMAAFGMPAYDPIRKSARFTAVVRAFGADPASFTKPTGARP